MSDTATEWRLDRLYRRLPAIYRIRDAEQGNTLRALLRVLSEQINLVEDAIAQQYENWFVETAEDWALPYIGDLVAYNASATAEGASHPIRDAHLLRRNVANAIANGRRKGTLALLPELALEVADWPAQAVEFRGGLGWHQNINHRHEERAQLVSLREMETLDQIGTPFERAARTVDIRRIDSSRTRGLYNIPSIGVHVWRLKPYPVTYAPAHCVEANGPHCFTFSVLGNDAPLFRKPSQQGMHRGLRTEATLPRPIGRRELQRYSAGLIGNGLSMDVWAEGWSGHSGKGPVPHTALIPADLTNWFYVPPLGHIAIDPELGRLAFPPGQLPRRGVRVTYHYGFSADLGGGEYSRQISDLSKRMVRHAPDGPAVASEPHLFRVGRNQKFGRLHDAISAWHHDQPPDAVIELTDSAVFVEPINLKVPDGSRLVLRAANGVRPVIRLLDWQTDLPDSLSITLGRGSQMTLDGLLITGRGVQVSGSEQGPGRASEVSACDAGLRISHCTLVPGWSIGSDGTADRPQEPSLEINNLRAGVAIHRSIIGSIRVREDEVRTDPIPVLLADSIVDAVVESGLAMGALDGRAAHAALTIMRCTVFGIIQTHSVILAENCIFNDCIHVARRQIGCIRYCYVPAGCRTPKRYACQPDLVVQAIAEKDPNIRQVATQSERLRVRPTFNGRRYGQPDYAQLAADCAMEVRYGADDRSEMGAFHFLYQPLREANLAASLADAVPAGMDVGIIYAT